MSYRIDYGGGVPVTYRVPRRKTSIQMMTALCMILFALAVGRFWPRGKQMLREVLLPGEPTVTEQAFSALVTDLTQGVELEVAMTAFCQQIIDHGAGELH